MHRATRAPSLLPLGHAKTVPPRSATRDVAAKAGLLSFNLPFPFTVGASDPAAHVRIPSQTLHPLPSVSTIRDPDCSAILVERSSLYADTSALLQSAFRPILPFKVEDMCPAGAGEAELRDEVLSNLVSSIPWAPDTPDHVSDRAADLIRREASAAISALHEAVGCSHVLFGIELIANTPCPRWHADHVGTRALITCFGAGTEFLDNRDADRKPVSAALKLATHGGFQLRPGGKIQQAGPGDLLILKGNAWPGFDGRGAVHRSPSAAGPDSPRLLLKFDPWHMENGAASSGQGHGAGDHSDCGAECESGGVAAQPQPQEDSHHSHEHGKDCGCDREGR